MKFIENLIHQVSPILHFAARVGFGLLIMNHGYQKLMGFGGLATQMENMGLPFPQVVAYLAVAIEFGGGLLITLGFKTRIFAALFFAMMCVAFFHVHGADPFHVRELAAIYAMAALLLMSNGGGRFAITRE